MKNKIMVNWINSWKGGNKKNKYSVTVRLGKLTLFEFKYCPCDRVIIKSMRTKKYEKCTKLRFMLLNLGFEL
jgi:hypothetical protein